MFSTKWFWAGLVTKVAKEGQITRGSSPACWQNATKNRYSSTRHIGMSDVMSLRLLSQWNTVSAMGVDLPGCGLSAWVIHRGRIFYLYTSSLIYNLQSEKSLCTPVTLCSLILLATHAERQCDVERGIWFCTANCVLCVCESEGESVYCLLACRPTELCWLMNLPPWPPFVCLGACCLFFSFL